MKIKRLYYVLSLLVMISMVLAACAPQVPATQAPQATEEPAATDAPMTEEPTGEPTAEPTAEPTTRRGGWLDEIDVSVVAADSAISQLQAGAIDMYSYGLASDAFPAIKEAGLPYAQSMGGSYSILFNPAVFTDTTSLNPFSNRKIREAMNWLIDRNYINQEIYAGGSLPKFFAITTQLVEYTDLVDTARALEAKYAFNQEKANEVITAEMEGMGFTVDRQYKTSTEAAPIWRGSIASEGLWHLYTAGWLPSGLTRDEKSQFQQMYLNSSVQGVDPFISNVSEEEFQNLGDDLAQGTFSTLEERKQMMAKAMELSLQDSLQVWTIEQVAYSPYNNNVQTTYDLAAGVEAAYVGPYNLRFKDQEGGTLKLGTADLFTEPWNTVSGSNWVWDSNIMRATTQGAANVIGSGGLMGDPYTGLAWPQRIESATLTYKEGLPIKHNLDWLTVETAAQIDVPEDAWVDWDATEQRFITAAEKFPEGTTANVKSLVVYPADLFDTVKW